MQFAAQFDQRADGGNLPEHVPLRVWRQTETEGEVKRTRGLFKVQVMTARKTVDCLILALTISLALVRVHVCVCEQSETLAARKLKCQKVQQQQQRATCWMTAAVR